MGNGGTELSRLTAVLKKETTRVPTMTFLDPSAMSNTPLLDRLQAMADGSQSNMLLPSTRFTLFALTAIVAGAALAFVT